MIDPAAQQSSHRILAVVRHPVGGVFTHIVYTYPLLLEHGYRFTFVVPANTEGQRFRQEVETWPQTEVVEAPSKGNQATEFHFGRVVRRLLSEKRFALVHCHGINAVPPVFLANLRHRVPLVVTSQDVFDHVEISPIVGRCKLYALSQLLRRASALVAVSDDTREDHLRFLPALSKGPCRIETIHNGIPIDQFASTNGNKTDKLRKLLGLDSNVFLMGFLGRFMQQKGFTVLIDALAELVSRQVVRPFHLVAVGSDDMEVNYKRRVAKCPQLVGHVSFIERTSEVAQVLSQLDLLVMPSLWEAHPLLPMEAMAVGVPVIGTTCLGLREVLRGTPSVMVPPDDVNELANAIQAALMSNWTDAARDYVSTARQRFDVRLTAKNLLRLFNSLLDSSRTGVTVRGKAAS